MAQAAFDPYRYLETLENSGQFSVDQAKGLAKALAAAQSESDLVTNAELRAGLAEVRGELKTGLAEVRKEIADLRGELRTEIATSANKIILWVVGINFALYGGMFAIMAKGFHWY